MGRITGTLKVIDESRSIGEIVGEDNVKYGVLLDDLPEGFQVEQEFAFEPIRIAFSRQPLATDLELIETE